jgi:hypothetical protein
VWWIESVMTAIDKEAHEQGAKVQESSDQHVLERVMLGVPF